MKDSNLFRYIVSLGSEGLGDRLQCLSYCIWLARTRNRILFVNWQGDPAWPGGFEHYFQLVNLPYVSKAPAFSSGQVHPGVFEHLLDVNPGLWVYDIKEPDITFPDTDIKIIVHPGMGFRRWDVSDLQNHLRFTPETAKAVDEKFRFLLNQSQGLPVVHVRGTDRPWELDKLRAFVETQPERVALLSDDVHAVNNYLWLRPQTVVLSKPREDNLPDHKHKRTEESTFQMLAEFCLLSTVENASAFNTESLFFRMARIIKSSKWFKSFDSFAEYSDYFKVCTLNTDLNGQ